VESTAETKQQITADENFAADPRGAEENSDDTGTGVTIAAFPCTSSVKIWRRANSG
jgi:hypothetical protein